MLKTLKTILGRLSYPVEKYARRRIDRAVNEINTDMLNLQSDVLVGQTLSDKLEILESLIHDVGKDLSLFWATTLDKPSEMWCAGKRYFGLQEIALADVRDKKRIVVLNKTKLAEEMSEGSDAMENFIRWHKDHNFKLLFLVDGDGADGAYVVEARQFLSRLMKLQHIVTDFAIMGDKWVYGEVAQDVNMPDRAVRLYEATVVDDYKKFYDSLWKNWDGYTWPIMSPKQILSERSRVKAKTDHLSQIHAYYQSVIGNGMDAPHCFNAVLHFLSSCTENDKIRAVDIAPLKPSKLRVWISAEEYDEWMKASIAAANNKCDFKRVYILNTPLGNRADAVEAYDKIFAPQLETNVDVWLIAARNLWAQEIPVHDFLLVKDKLCLSLTWEEIFSRDSFSSKKNLEHPSTFCWYESVFNNIVASPDAKSLRDVSREVALNYLASHQW